MNDFLLIFKALADRNRLRIMAALLQYNELCACQLTELLDVAGATSSRHLALLQNSGLIRGRKRGRWVFYSLAEKVPHEFPLAWLQDKLLRAEDIVDDQKRLSLIMAENPEVICRRQRGEGSGSDKEC